MQSTIMNSLNKGPYYYYYYGAQIQESHKHN